MEKHEIYFNKNKFYYWVLNPRSEKTILLIHGFRGNHKGLVPLAEKLKNYKIIIPDLPGYGKSSCLKHKHTLLNYAKFLKNLVNAENLKKFDFVGHSYGASVSIVYASLYKKDIDKLILITPTAESETFLAKVGLMYYKTAMILPNILKHYWLESWLFNTLSGEVLLKTPNYRKRFEIVRKLNKNIKEFKDSVIIENYLSYFNTPVYSLARNIRSKTLIIAGKEDNVSPVETQMKFNHLIDNSEVKLIEKAGHLVPIESPAKVARIIQDFLDK